MPIVEKFAQHSVAEHPEWLGGVFEVGGFLSFLVTTDRHGTSYGLPVMGMGDKELVVVENLAQFAGGSVRSKTKPTKQWQATGARAAWLGAIMEPYAPSWGDVISAFEVHTGLDGREQKVDLARRFIGKENRVEVPLAVYNGLVQSPEFVGGVVDARGSFSFQGHADRNPSPRLSVNTTNLSLLESLQNNLGGSLNVKQKTAETTIAGNPARQLKDSGAWTADGETFRAVMNLVAPHLYLRQFPNK